MVKTLLQGRSEAIGDGLDAVKYFLALPSMTLTSLTAVFGMGTGAADEPVLPAASAPGFSWGNAGKRLPNPRCHCR